MSKEEFIKMLNTHAEEPCFLDMVIALLDLSEELEEQEMLELTAQLEPFKGNYPEILKRIISHPKYIER